MSSLLIAVAVGGLLALGVLAYLVYLLARDTVDGEADPYQSRPART